MLSILQCFTFGLNKQKRDSADVLCLGVVQKQSANRALSRWDAFVSLGVNTREQYGAARDKSEVG